MQIPEQTPLPGTCLFLDRHIASVLSSILVTEMSRTAGSQLFRLHKLYRDKNLLSDGKGTLTRRECRVGPRRARSTEFLMDLLKMRVRKVTILSF